MKKDINKSVEFMIKIADDNSHGYDQINRNGPDYDCSSLVATALYKGGFDVSPRSWTGNLESQLRKNGFKECKPPWKAGDIHLNILHHVAMSINEYQICQASINENNDVVGGVSGDQTGNEISIMPYYEYDYGWDLHLRYFPKNDYRDIANEVMRGEWGNGEERKQRLESVGYDYQTVQALVNKISTSLNNMDKIVNEVMRGKWGNGEERKQRLESAGYDYITIQNVINNKYE